MSETTAPSDFARWLEGQKVELDRAKIKGFGVKRGIINLIRNLSDTAEATDANLVGTVVNSGAFKIEAAPIAYIAFSDVGD